MKERKIGKNEWKKGDKKKEIRKEGRKEGRKGGRKVTINMASSNTGSE